MEERGSPQEAVVHPLVLLSVADHYNREAKDSRGGKRVVGVLLGSKCGNQVDITNSFAVPFDEDLSNPAVWFLDHNFLDTMFWMFKKVNCKFFFDMQTKKIQIHHLFAIFHPLRCFVFVFSYIFSTRRNHGFLQ